MRLGLAAKRTIGDGFAEVRELRIGFRHAGQEENSGGALDVRLNEKLTWPRPGNDETAFDMRRYELARIELFQFFAQGFDVEHDVAIGEHHAADDIGRFVHKRPRLREGGSGRCACDDAGTK